MSELTAFSARDINARERLEDYAIDAQVTTKGGLELQIALACDGAGGGDAGELAARLTSRAIIDYIEISDETDIPKLITRAVEEANRVVYDELNGSGSSTVALVVIDMQEDPFGRMFIASVGDSRIYLIRDKQLVRLNTDHTLANEYVIAGQMSQREASSMDNASDLMRSIGMGPKINVDIGFYAERGKKFVPATRAFQLGIKGLGLREGDTIIAATDGLFTINTEDGNPYLREPEMLMYALENDVEKATKMLMRFASDRQPKDNTAISMVFVPSPERKAVRAPLSPALKRNITVAGVLLSCIIIMLFAVLIRQFNADRAQRSVREQTQVAFEGTINAQSARLTEAAGSVPTPTIQPTPRPRPTISVAGQVGFQFFLDGATGPVVVGERYSAPDINYLLTEGEEGPLGIRRIFEPGEYYLQPDTLVQLDALIGIQQQESIEFTLDDEGDVFGLNGQFINQGVRFNLFDNVDVSFFSETDCIAIRHFPPDPLIENDHPEVALTCFTGNRGDCTYTIGNQTEDMDIGRRILIDLDTNAVIQSGPILYDEVKTYSDTVFRLTNERERAECLTPFLDGDGDGIPYPTDQCPDEGEFGQVNDAGCPDQDGDGFADNEDECPDVYGELDGCPLSDFDDDGYPDIRDQCPEDNGLDENGEGFGVDTVGCPLTSLDSDNDGIPDTEDDCPNDGDRSFNPTNPFIDANGCPLDTDNDGVPNSQDQCPFIGESPLGIGEDGCPLGDSDGDGIPDEEDQCPTDGDAFGDGVDETGCTVTDVDDDGVPDDIDQCFNPPDPDSDIIIEIDDVGCPIIPDDDGDGVSNEDDVCPLGNDNLDTDDDGIPNDCDPDLDGDGVLNVLDDCPAVGDQGDGVDADGCPINPNATTTTPTPGPQPATVVPNVDTDGDGFLDSVDACPTQGPSAFGLDGTGCPIPGTADNDGDGVTNSNDNCVNTPGPITNQGCPEGTDPNDIDNDGVPNATDGCPTVAGTVQGCPDTDGDGVPENLDQCDNTAGINNGASPINGCPDADGDGIPDIVAESSGADVCPNAAFNGDGGTDNGAGSGILGCPDVDGDGIPNIMGVDNCPADASTNLNDLDGDTPFVASNNPPYVGAIYFPNPADPAVGGDICDNDDDNDGVDDGVDNCPTVANPAPQLDDDLDGIGDACDDPTLNNPDDDGDGIPDSADVCPGIDTDADGLPDTESNDRLDTDNDGIPNGCDPDDDNDGDDDVTDPDIDGDGVPNASDQCEGYDDNDDNDFDGIADGCDPDDDNDGLPDSVDPAPYNPTNGIIDSDGDGVPNGSDVCAFGNDNLDSDGDNIPDACDFGEPFNDPDGDGDFDDPPFAGFCSDPSWQFFWDVYCDIDEDNDGVGDNLDVCPGGDDTIDTDGDGTPDDCDPDDDNDTILDAFDICNATSSPPSGGFPSDDRFDIDLDGIANDCDPDDDNDGVADVLDQCLVGNNAIDTDGDGIPNDCDYDDDGDGVTDNLDDDDDNDGVPDPAVPGNPQPGEDLCPFGPLGGLPAVNADGCIDSDSDTIPDNDDNCPNTANLNQDNNYGGPAGDACDNNDGDTHFDANDNCPLVTNEGQENFNADAEGDACDNSDGDAFFDDVDDCPTVTGVSYLSPPNPAGGHGCPDDDEVTAGNPADGVPDNVDNCPDDFNPLQENNDGGMFGDVCDPNDDGDAILDVNDDCPLVTGIAFAGPPAGGNGCPDDGETGAGNTADGIPDIVDDCPTIAGVASANGCPDGDGDGVQDSADNCPGISNPGQEDNDGDFGAPVADPGNVGPPADFFPSGGDLCDTDDDNDGILDTAETAGCEFNPGCRPVGPNPPTPPREPTPPRAPTTAPIVVPTAPVDTDGDGIPDSIDICSRGDDKIDSDGDGIPDACDN